MCEPFECPGIPVRGVVFPVNLWALAFWTGLGLLAYTFAGYPVLMGLVAAVRPRRPVARPPPPADPPSVSVVLCVHNEQARVRPRLANLCGSDYPAEKLELVVVSDGSTDRTVDRVREFVRPPGGRQVGLIALERRAGKAKGLNVALAHARGDIVVFADARQRFLPDTVRLLVARLADRRVGAVSGSLEIEPSASSTGAGVDAYWRLEKFVRRSESALGTTIGCTGAVYAIRRELFEPLPEDTLLDDVLIPMKILTRGFRVEFEPRAVAMDPQSLEPGRERLRKQRTLAGNFQLLFRYPGWLMPWKNRACGQLISHKYLRLAAPWCLLSTLVTNGALVGQPFYRWTLAGQIGLYTLAFVGLCFRRASGRMFSIPAGFVFLNGMAVAGLLQYLRGGTAAWDREATVREREDGS